MRMRVERKAKVRPIGPRLLPRLEESMVDLQLVRDAAKAAGDRDMALWAEGIRRRMERRRDWMRKKLGLPPVVRTQQAA